MINIDIAVVTYNSKKWINGFFKAFNNLDYELSHIHLLFKDNGSTDGTVEALNSFEDKSKFGTFAVCSGTENIGFGAGSNKAAQMGKSPYILFLNIDTEVEPDSFKILSETVKKSAKDVAVWEMRQFPYEHPKIYSPVTLETSWASGACFLLRRDVFEVTGGFDESIFMYGEDVELSWRIRALGYKLLYVPSSCLYHFSYASADELKPTQYFGSIKANIMLRWRYGNVKQILNGYKKLLKVYLHPAGFKDVRGKISKIIIESLRDGVKFRNKYGKLNSHVGKFIGYDYEYARSGAFYENERFDVTNQPLVSVIVRTCGRPEILAECLESIENQTYKNIEVCIAEDGPEVSREFIKENFSRLNVKYFATGQKKGRSNSGNKALQMASGEYLNFLDDDDVFYCDHIETMVNAALKKPHEKLFYAKSFETPIEIKSKNPYVYELKDFVDVKRADYSKANLIASNLFPIQTVFFKREVYEKFGGFNTEYEYLEDWDLWLRYSAAGEYNLVDKLTSEYRVPSVPKIAAHRARLLQENEETIRGKYVKYQKERKGKETQETGIYNSKHLKYNIDSIKVFGGKSMQIVGWVFWEKYVCQGDMFICITYGDNEKRLFSVDRYQRVDVNEAYPEVECKECGISAWIPLWPFEGKKIHTVEIVCISDDKYYINKNRRSRFYKSEKIRKIMLKLNNVRRLDYRKRINSKKTNVGIKK